MVAHGKKGKENEKDCKKKYYCFMRMRYVAGTYGMRYRKKDGCHTVHGASGNGNPGTNRNPGTDSDSGTDGYTEADGNPAADCNTGTGICGRSMV